MRIGIGEFAPERRDMNTKNWMSACSSDEVDMLRDLSARLRDSLDLITADERGLEEEVDFHALWIGLLLGDRRCKSFQSAYSWATFVRYNTEGLVS